MKNFKIYRTDKKEGNFLMIDKSYLKDENLSLKSKGLMTILLNIDDEKWEFTEMGLAIYTKEGISTIRSAIKELVESGYLIIEKEKPTKENGGRKRTYYFLKENKTKITTLDNLNKNYYIRKSNLEYPIEYNNLSNQELIIKEINKESIESKELRSCFYPYLFSISCLNTLSTLKEVVGYDVLNYLEKNKVNSGVLEALLNSVTYTIEQEKPIHNMFSYCKKIIDSLQKGTKIRKEYLDKKEVN